MKKCMLHYLHWNIQNKELTLLYESYETLISTVVVSTSMCASLLWFYDHRILGNLYAFIPSIPGYISRHEIINNSYALIRLHKRPSRLIFYSTDATSLTCCYSIAILRWVLFFHSTSSDHCHIHEVKSTTFSPYSNCKWRNPTQFSSKNCYFVE